MKFAIVHKKMKPICAFIFIIILSCANTQSTIECTRMVFKETIEEISEFTNTQLDTLQNLPPETKKMLKATIMDVLTSMGLLLEVSVAPTFSLSTLPVYIFRAQNLMTLLSKDIENLQPETGGISESLEEFKNGLTSVVNGIPMKALKCLK